MTQTEQWVYSFEEGDGADKKLLGGKGANLCAMTQMGLRVPPGFVITTAACLCTLEHPRRDLPDGLREQVQSHIGRLEELAGKGFGDPDNPLLVSVRSGSAISMPGMMDTVLNLGLNAATVEGLAQQTGNERFAYDAYRRFIQLFGKVTLGIGDEHFDTPFESVKQRIGAASDVELGSEHLRDIC
jgi:pyruvate,orthophosphate dikinase